MKTIVLLVFLSLMTLAQAADRPVKIVSDDRRPAISVERALEIAKKYVEDNKIDVSDKYIHAVQLDWNPRGDRGNYWRVTYELNRSAKGGQIYLMIYMDRTVEIGYGE